MKINTEPRIESLPETCLAGHRLELSHSQNRTRELWSGFMPRVGEIANRIGKDLYSVETYPSPDFFRDYDPDRRYEKWACVRVPAGTALPPGFHTLLIPEGPYAVFRYMGKPSQAAPFYRAVLGEWFPASPYTLDHRPHLAIMGEDYKGEHPQSVETLWFPIRPI